MVTPTGAAILATLARFEVPAIAIERVGYGFGRKHFPWPNCLRLCIGQTYGTTVADDEADTDWVTVIESNIDNMSGELLGGCDGTSARGWRSRCQLHAHTDEKKSASHHAERHLFPGGWRCTGDGVAA